MNIAFLCIFYKTILYKKTADYLSTYGINTFWISTSIKWNKWLVKKGIPEKNILYLDIQEALGINITREAQERATRIEASSGSTIKSIFYMDRIISHWKWENANKYGLYCIDRISKFLISNNIKIVFSEATAYQEIITSLICKYYNIYFFSPSSIRIPGNRFAFFYEYLKNRIYEINSNPDTTEYEDIVKDVINKVIVNKEKPYYWYENNKIPKYDYHFFARTLKKIPESLLFYRYDPMIKPFKYHLLYEKKYLKPIRHYLSKKLFENPILNEKYVLYTLHKQPESSIDVLGFRNNNQIELIKAITKELPYNISLYVKEHSNALGERPIKDLKYIRNLPGVKLIDPFYDTFELIKNSELVVTVSGTVAFEAGLLNKKAVTFSPLFFNKLPNVEYITDVTKIKTILKNNEVKSSNKKINEIMTYFIANSFEGIISDPLSTPNCIDEKNINNISVAILKLINHIKRNNQ